MADKSFLIVFTLSLGCDITASPRMIGIPSVSINPELLCGYLMNVMWYVYVMRTAGQVRELEWGNSLLTKPFLSGIHWVLASKYGSCSYTPGFGVIVV